MQDKKSIIQEAEDRFWDWILIHALFLVLIRNPFFVVWHDAVCKVHFETALCLGTKEKERKLSSFAYIFRGTVRQYRNEYWNNRRWELIKETVHKACCGYAFEIYLFLIIGLLHVQ